MPPKKGKGVKGKNKYDDDEAWESKEKAAPVLSPPAAEEEAEPSFSHGKKAGGMARGFAGLSLEDPPEAADENEDFGGLMSAIKSSAKPKKEKKKKKTWEDYDDLLDNADAAPEADGAAAPAEPLAAPTEMTAEELADQEFGGGKKKGKKGKKGKSAQDEDEAEPAATASPVPAAAAGSDEEADIDKKPLSKKEKERLKKEREKEKRKQESVAKKVTETGEAATPATPATPAEPAGGEAAAEATGGKMSKAQKKKLKQALGGAEPEPPKPEAKPGKAPSKAAAKIAALKEAQEALRLAREEAEKKAEEERKRIEEEERKKEEEAKRQEELKRLKKEREKEKRDQLKKEGKLLTPKQKAAQRQAELRKQALLANPNIAIAALQDTPSGSGAPAKIRYGTREKKTKPAAATGSSSRPESPAPVAASPAPSATAPLPAEAKDSWEDESEEEATKPVASAAAPGVKDDWDMSSDEEAPPEATSTPAPVEKPATKPSAPVKSPAVAPSKGPAKTPPAKGKPPAGKAESEESEDDSEEDSDEDSEEETSEEDSSDEELTAAQREAERRKQEAAARKEQRIKDAMAARSKDDLRSPICCILGHVDTGKTKLLDKIRQTNVQEGEAGGITQQIGATYFPVDAIREKTRVISEIVNTEVKIPGLLIIDTPGHESFTNLRSRGSSLCNIAVLVVDIMHGLEPQTLESLRLLRDKKTPFIVALNKIDRMYGWEAIPNNGFRDSIAKQKSGVRKEFEKRLQDTILAFAEQGLNAKLYYENDNPGRIVSLVPTSAITGEGIPDMIMLLVKLTQERMSDRLMYLSEVECTVLEVKVIEGLGTTIDVVLSNGILREGDKIVLCGLNGPIVTQIRALLTPQPLRELRIKSAYVHHKEVKAALGVKITGQDLEKAIAGSRLLVCTPDDDVDELKEEVMSDLTSLMDFIDKNGRGVCVQASTLGSLEALLDFLKVSRIPVSGINIGPVHKKDIMRASTMLEKARELACILCFDVSVDKEAETLAKDMGIRLFKADIIYHLFDAFTAYHKEIEEAKRRDAAPQAIWPCRLKIIACFAKRDPIILGVDIIEGSLRTGTPLCVVKTDAAGKKDIIRLGKITSLEINHKAMEIVKKSQAGAGVAVKVEHAVYESAKMFGRHFDDKDEVISHITRESIDVLKETFRKDVLPEEWVLIKNLKPKLGIP